MHAFGDGFLTSGPEEFGAHAVRAEVGSNNVRLRTHVVYRVSTKEAIAALAIVVVSSFSASFVAAPIFGEMGRETSPSIVVAEADGVSPSSVGVELQRPVPVVTLNRDVAEQAWKEAIALIAKQGEDPREIIELAAMRVEAWRFQPKNRGTFLEFSDFDSVSDEDDHEG